MITFSSNVKRDGSNPNCGAASVLADLPGLLYMWWIGEAKLDVEYLFGLEKTVGNPELDSLYSGGVVGSD